MNASIRRSCIIFCLSLICSCKSVDRPRYYKWFPDNYSEVQHEYEQYYHYAGCRPGETIASIGAGNGMKEVWISCFVKGISWYLEEIDSARLYEFENVRAYHERLIDSPIDATFTLVLGDEDYTGLPEGIFDRVLMFNVFHEIASSDSRLNIMMEIHQLLKPDGELVLMERMGRKPGDIHGDCKFPMLMEPAFLNEMQGYGYTLENKTLAEAMSNLMFYTFKSED